MRPIIAGARWALAISLTATGCQAQTLARPGLELDGHKWITLSDAAREGFVAGFSDCYKWVVRGPEKFEAKPLSDYAELVSHLYQAGGSALAEPVVQTMLKVADGPGVAPPSGGEAWDAPHGYFDGLYWRQSLRLGGREKQMGFVEGYLSCNRALANERAGRFSAASIEYVRRVDEWYGFNTITGEMNPTREGEKIAQVLSKVR